MLRKFAQMVAIMALLTSAAPAQTPDAAPSAGIPFNAKLPPTADEIERQKAAERDYDAAVKKIPDKKATSDPWGDVRPTAKTPSKTKPPQQQPQ